MLDFTKLICFLKMNKIIVSIVLTIVLVVGINKITDVIYYVEKPEKSAYQITQVADETSNMTAESSGETSEANNILVLLASASATEGGKTFKKCAACHSIAKGGKNKIGPALWGIIGRNSGSVDGYKYSKGMMAHGKPWSFEEMNGFLIKPKDWVKGTKMSFAGLKSAKERADVILYMNENSDNSLPVN